MKQLYGFAFVVIVLLLFVWSAPGQKKAQPKTAWEYKQIGRHTQTGEEELNELGAQGWELVTVNDSATVFYLKRQK